MDEQDGRKTLEHFFANLKSSYVQKRLISLFLKFIDVSFTAGAVICPALGSVHCIVKLFYPNYNQEEIMKNFLDLKRMINKINNKLMESILEDKWNHIKTRFLVDIDTLEYAVQTTSLAMKAEKEEFAINWMEDLMGHGTKLMHSLNHLLDGLSNEENQCEFDDQILIAFYNYSGGNKRKIERLCVYLDHLLLNGLASLCVYLAAKKGIDWCHEVVNNFNYEQRLSRSVGCMKMILEKCETECNANMRNDVKGIFKRELDCGPQDLLLKISEIYAKKYYWMETFFILYSLVGRNAVASKDFTADKMAGTTIVDMDESDGMQHENEFVTDGCDFIEHFSSINPLEKSDEVDSHAQSDRKRFAFFIFARKKVSDEVFMSRSKVMKLVEESVNFTTNPHAAFQNIKRELDLKQIPYWGIAVMKHTNFLRRPYANILTSGSNETCEAIWMTRGKCTVCILLGKENNQATNAT